MPAGIPGPAHVRSRVVEMCNPASQGQLEMTLIERNQEVERFAAQCSADLLACLLLLSIELSPFEVKG